jgi:hypothetical protein
LEQAEIGEDKGERGRRGGCGSTMFPTAGRRKRARPSMLSLGLSIIVAVVAVILILDLFGEFYYAPLYAAVVVGLLVLLLRSRGLTRKVPHPYGAGMEDVVSPRAAVRTGILMIVGGVALVVIPLASIFFLPVAVFFAIYLALGLGISLGEVFQFAWVTRLEARTGAEVYAISEEARVEGEDAIIKRVVLIPRSPGAAGKEMNGGEG